MKKHLVSECVHLGKASSSTLARFNLGNANAREKAILPKAKREAAGAPNPDGHAVQLHVMGGSIRHGHEIANCCSPLLEDMEASSRPS